jgi:hypothetical protein
MKKTVFLFALAAFILADGCSVENIPYTREPGTGKKIYKQGQEPPKKQRRYGNYN